MSIRDVLIVGAGPTGLSAAIAAKKRGLDYQVLEQGTLVNSIYRFPPQMVFFTTPELMEIGGLPFVSPYDKPTRTEALRYYRKVVDTYDLQIAYEEQVLSIEVETETGTARSRARQREAEGLDRSVTREGGWAASAEAPASVAEAGRRPGPPSRKEDSGPASREKDDIVFALTTRSSRGVRRVRHARSVILAIGYFDRPVMLGIPGEDLPHVHHYYSDPHPYYRQRVVVVGGGNSAAEWALELYRANASVTLVHRAPELKSTIKYWVRPDIENRIKEGTIAARFNTIVTEIRPTAVVVNKNGDADIIPADAVFLLTGYRADIDLMRGAGVEITEREGPVYDPETFETNVPNLFVAGGAIAGVDTGTIFIENGRFHGEKIVGVIAARLTD